MASSPRSQHRPRSPRTLAKRSLTPTALGDRARTRLVAGVSFAALVLALLLRNFFLFRSPVYENGDQAANSILVNQADHLTLLVGNYSRLRFNHPGPALLYVQAAGQQLLYSLLHAVPARYNGQVLADVGLNAALLALTALVVCRRLRSAALGGAFLLVCLVVTASQLRWADTWMPYLYAAPFLLALAAGASVASGTLGELPLLVLAGGLLVHGHIAFIPMFGVFFVLVCVTFVVRRRRDLLQAMRSQRVALAVSGGLAALFLLPIVLELALHWPGPWARYWEYTTQSHSKAHPLADVLHFVAQYWSAHWSGRALLGAASIAAGVLAVTERDPDRRRFLVMLLGSCGAMTLLFVAYVMRGVDALGPVNDYVGYFYFTVPAAVVATAVVAGGLRLAASLQGVQWARTAGAVVAGLAAVAGFAYVVRSPSFDSPITGDPNLPQLASVVAAARPAPGSSVVVDLPNTAPLAAGWPGVTALIVAATRDGYHVCVDDPWWTFMMTTQYICGPADQRQALKVMVLPAGLALPAGWARLTGDAQLTVATEAPA